MINGFKEEKRAVTLITPLGNFRTWSISSSYERAAGTVFTAISSPTGLLLALLSPPRGVHIRDFWSFLHFTSMWVVVSTTPEGFRCTLLVVL